ncbi:uncharacterized protein [Palaemon carinicauda]|uniref:uncharacterized protein n=1 Tax=Palaemon carinicauda TaxID=392227 RepID=UPI0035B6491D
MKWITLSGIVLFLAQTSFTADDTVYTSALAMLNERGRLPCDVSSGLPGDRIVLILWYRGAAGTPIYSFDARGTSIEKGTHWVDTGLLQKRAYFQLSQTNGWISNSKFGAHLEIQPVKDKDQAVYRCRVDYLLSPTKNTIINFTVIIPPNRPQIYNESEQLVGSKKSVSIIGPYNEGSKLILVCKVTGGRPPPVIFWVVKDEVWRTEVEEEAVGSLRTTLEIPSLTRNYPPRCLPVSGD